jgi:hypothetical protein
LEGTSWFIVGVDFFGARSGFAFELLGGHEKVQQGRQRRIHGGQERLFLKALKPVIPRVFTDDGVIEAVIVFHMVTVAGKEEFFFGRPDFSGMVDKYRTVIAMELENGKGDGVSDI